MKSERFYELMFKSLAILSFVSICWVMHRTLDAREECIHSDQISEVVTLASGRSGPDHPENLTINNCSFESRLAFSQYASEPSADLLNLVRRLESLSPLAAIWPKPAPMIRIEIDFSEPFAFEMKPGLLRIGATTAQAVGQLERGVTLALLNTHFKGEVRTPFENEVTADFLLMSILDQSELEDPSSGEKVSFNHDTNFALTNRSLNEYCASSWKSLTHFMICSVQEPGKHVHDVSSWGTRPLIAKVLWRVYDELSLGEKIEMMRSVFSYESLREVEELSGLSSVSLADWTIRRTKSFLTSWNMSLEKESVNLAFKRALMLEQVFKVTQWDYTIEITEGPQWELLWRGLKQWSQLNPSKHVLVWSPVGAHAFPQGIPVDWSEKDIRTQKHLLVACKWPRAHNVMAIEARQFVALQVCSEDQLPQWDFVLAQVSNQKLIVSK